MKSGRLIVQPGKPLEFLVEEDIESKPTESTRRISEALVAYIRAGAELLKGRYAYLADMAPRHLRECGDIFVIRCTDGVLVRYDQLRDEHRTIRVAEFEQSLTEITPVISERYLYLDTEPQGIAAGNFPQLNLTLVDPTGAPKGVSTFQIGLIASSKLPDGFAQARPPARPIPTVAVQSEVDIELAGHSEEANPAPGPIAERQQFIAHGRLQLPVGWLTIEIYAPLGDEYWQTDAAPMWAELDILATSAKRNLRLTELNALDSRVDTRESYRAILDEFQGLLQGPEEPVHQFLKAHHELISPTSAKYWSKLRFGDRVSDFVFRDPNNDYELVELEAPIRRLFRKDGQQREELTHAINQISDWIQYIVDNKQKVENELGLTGISASPRSLVVIGRSNGLTADDRRKLTTIQNQTPKLRIITYDDLLADARATLEHILGPLDLKGQNLRIYFKK